MHICHTFTENKGFNDFQFWRAQSTGWRFACRCVLDSELQAPDSAEEPLAPMERLGLARFVQLGEHPCGGRKRQSSAPSHTFK